tara:strand:- start:2135 stop:3478 length:1344 start_codon:yes stop_codon:yes gene_type:complete
MKIISISFIILFYTGAYSQVSWSATEFPKKDSLLENIKYIHSNQIEKYENKKALEKVYEWRFNYVKHLLETKAILYNDSLYQYVDFIFSHIIKSNSNLKSLELRYFISNSPNPNAISLGDGTFIVNLGLIRKLENEGQLAFIICHEIAHFYLDHSNQSAIDRYVKTHSKEHKKEIKSIANQRFGRYEILKSMIKKNLYVEMTHTRQHETEADSLGLIFLRNTIYDHAQSITCMNLLDSIDYYKYHKEINYIKNLSFEKYPFRKRWLESETIMFGGHIENNYWERDSIKSHPDSKTRANSLKNSLLGTEAKPSNKFLQDSTYFNLLKDQADLEFINSWVFYGDYGHALFFSLKHLEYEPNNKYLLLKSSHLFRLIYDSQVNHQFSQHIDRPSSENEKEYNHFLDFLDNIRTTELANIAYHYHLSQLELLRNDETFFDDYNYFKTKTGN